MCGWVGSEEGGGAHFLTRAYQQYLMVQKSRYSRPQVKSPQFQTAQHPAANALFPLTEDNGSFVS